MKLSFEQRPISLLNDVQVMNLVTNDHETHCQHGDFVLPTDAQGAQRPFVETVI